MTNGSGGQPPIIKTPSSSARLDVAFAWPPRQPLAKDLRRFTSTLESRLARDEAQIQEFQEIEATVVQSANLHLNEVLGPSVNKILKLASHGFLVRASTFSFEPVLGAQQIFIIDDQDIDVFQPTAFVTFSRFGSVDDWGIARVLTWNNTNGELGVQFTHTDGNMGPHNDWIVSATAAEAPFMVVKAAEVTDSQEAVLEARDATAADRAVVSSDKAATSADRATVSGYITQAADLLAATTAQAVLAEDAAERAEGATVALDPTALQAQINTLNTTKAPLASPAFTGVPTASTASLGNETTQLATTAFVQAAKNLLLDGVAAAGNTLNKLYTLTGGFQTQIDTLSSQKAPKTSPVFSGDVTVGTIAPGDNTTKAASTAFVTAADTAAIATEVTNRNTAISGAIATEVTNRNTAISTAVATETTNRNTALAGKETLGENAGVNTQTGTAYTLVLTDKGKSVEMNNAAANTLTVPPNSSVAFPIKTWLNVVQYGAGQTSVAAGAGVTIRNAIGLKIGHQYGMATLYKRGTDEWVLVGDLKA